MGIITDVGSRPAVVWAPWAAEPWLRAPLDSPPLASPPLTSLPTATPEWPVAPVRPIGVPSRMVAMARVLATWREAERQVASLEAADPRGAAAEAAVEAARLAHHRLFAEHVADVVRR